EGHSATTQLIVTPKPVASVEVTPVSPEIAAGGTVEFKATIRAADGSVLTDRSIVWSSSHENVARVSPATGLATGISAGTASITAEVEGKTGATDLTVRQPLTIDPPLIRLGILSQPRQLRLFFNGVEVPPQQAQWRSS